MFYIKKHPSMNKLEKLLDAKHWNISDLATKRSREKSDYAIALSIIDY